MRKTIYSIVTFLAIFVNTQVSAQTTEVYDELEETQNYDDNDIYLDSIQGLTGSIDIPEAHMIIDVPQGFVFINKEQARHLITEYWDYEHDDCLVGAFIPDTAKIYYDVDMAFSIYNNEIGYVDQSDANDFNVDTYKNIFTSSDDSTFFTTQWIIEPHYDSTDHLLENCRQIESHSQLTETGEYVISEALSYYLYLYNRLGYVNINTYADIDRLDDVLNARTQIIRSVFFYKNFDYDDFDSNSDQRANYTIGSSGLDVYNSPTIKTGDDTDEGIYKLIKYLFIGILTVLATMVVLRIANGRSDREDERRRD